MNRVNSTRIWAATIVATFFWLGSSKPAAAQDANCSAMLSLSIRNTEILSATVVAGTGPLPAHCRVVGVTHGEPGSNVGFDVRLPVSWNGKLLMTTRQAFIGSVAPLVNAVVSSGLIRGYATVSTDSGHQSSSILDASFGLNNRAAEIDFGYRGAHLAKMAATAVMTGYYGSAPVHSYYQGCSSSGRYAIQVAEHYPSDFDGIIAGAPVVDMSGLVTDQVYIEQAMRTAPLPEAKLSVIWSAVTAACDGVDGLPDGLIDDPRDCHFDVSTLQCRIGDAPTCLTAAEVGTLKKIYAGAFNSSGQQLYPGFALGGELPDPDNGNGWDVYIIGSDLPPLDIVLSDQYLRYLAFDPDRPNFDWTTFNFDTDTPSMSTMHQIIDPVRDDLSAFGDAGGKMIIYQGWGDIAQSPYRTIEYYQGLRRHVGRRTVEDYARLFMAPGMYHCGGGVGANKFDALTAIEQWVEQGQAPSSIIASHNGGSIGTDRTRPLCPFPQHAKYKGSGSTDDAANFECHGAPVGTGQGPN